MPECVLPIFRLCPSVNDRLFYLCLRAVNAGLRWNLSYWLQTCLSVGLQYVLLSGRSFFFSNTQLDQTYCTVSVSTGTLPFVNVTAVAIHRTRRAEASPSLVKIQQIFPFLGVNFPVGSGSTVVSSIPGFTCCHVRTDNERSLLVH